MRGPARTVRRAIVLGALLVGTGAFQATPVFAAGVTGTWSQQSTDAAGTNYSNVYTVQQDEAGNVTGTGHASTGFDYTITGHVSGTTFSFTRRDTTGGYVAEVTGTLSGTTHMGTFTDNNGNSGTFAAQRTSRPVRITSATRDFRARAKRRKAKLKTLVERLGRRATALEKDIVEEHRHANDLQNAVEELADRIRRLDPALDRTQSALKALGRIETGAPKNVMGLLEAEERYAGQVSRLVQQIIDADREGADTAGVREELRLARKQLDAVEGVLEDRLKGTEFADLRSRWLASLRQLKSDSFALRDAEAKLLQRQGATEARLTALTGDLGIIYRQLFEAGERLAGFDPDVVRLDVTAAGQPVFSARAGAAYAKVLALDEQIDEQLALVAEIERRKKPAFQEFYESQRRANIAQKHLGDVLYGLAYARFATDLAFETYDIVKATAKGGVVGAVAELGKKLLERGLTDLAGKPGSGIEEGSIEADVNREFQADLKDSWSNPQITRVVASRIVKDTAFKSINDGLVKPYIGAAVYRHVEFPVRQLIRDSPARPGELISQAQSFLTKIKRIEHLQTQLKNLEKGYLTNFAGKPELKKFFKGTAENLAKDAAKTLIKGLWDKVERDAWVDFFNKAAFAHSKYSPWHQLADLWVLALERRDELFATKARLLGDLDPRGGLTPEAAADFAEDAQLQITLTLAGSADPDDPIQVWVGGTRATRAGTSDVYTIAAAAVKDTDGALALELK